MMKTKQIILLLGFLLARPLLAAGKEVKIGVNGMVCGFCAQGITKTFKAEEAVASVDVRLNDKTVTLILKESQDLSDTKITEILKDAGYNVTKIERH